jgi:hypothetical protein
MERVTGGAVAAVLIAALYGISPRRALAKWAALGYFPAEEPVEAR